MCPVKRRIVVSFANASNGKEHHSNGSHVVGTCPFAITNSSWRTVSVSGKCNEHFTRLNADNSSRTILSILSLALDLCREGGDNGNALGSATPHEDSRRHGHSYINIVPTAADFSHTSILAVMTDAVAAMNVEDNNTSAARRVGNVGTIMRPVTSKILGVSKTYVAFDLDNTLIYCPRVGRNARIRAGAFEMLSALEQCRCVTIVVWTRSTWDYACSLLQRSGLAQFVTNRTLLTDGDCEASYDKYGVYKSSQFLCDRFGVDSKSVVTVLVDDIPSNGMNSQYDYVLWLMPFSDDLCPVMGGEELAVVGNRWNEWSDNMKRRNFDAAVRVERELTGRAISAWKSYSLSTCLCLPTLPLVHLFLAKRLGIPVTDAFASLLHCDYGLSIRRSAAGKPTLIVRNKWHATCRKSAVSRPRPRTLQQQQQRKSTLRKHR